MVARNRLSFGTDRVSGGGPTYEVGWGSHDSVDSANIYRHSGRGANVREAVRPKRPCEVRVHQGTSKGLPHAGDMRGPPSNVAIEAARLLQLIRALFTMSQRIYGALPVFLDLREAGETCSIYRFEHPCARTARAPGTATALDASRSAN